MRPYRRTTGQGRTELPSLHEEREVPGDNLATDAHGLVPGVGEQVAVHRDGLAVILVSPTGIVPETLQSQGDIGIERSRKWLAIVEGFQGLKEDECKQTAPLKV